MHFFLTRIVVIADVTENDVLLCKTLYTAYLLCSSALLPQVESITILILERQKTSPRKFCNLPRSHGYQGAELGFEHSSLMRTYTVTTELPKKEQKESPG